MSFVPYQVDFSIRNVSKTIGFSKKRVQFKFGIANQSSLAQGLQGVDCRGSEHDLTFTWSLKSGKRQLILDGKDIHFSESGQNGWTADRVWQHGFTLRDAASGRRYRCHFITQPKNSDIPDVQPFDLKIQGVSYFSFNRIYELGTPQMITRSAPSRDESPMSPEERRLVAQAKAESLRELDHQKHRRQTSMQRTEPVDLLAFDTPAPPPVAVGPARAPQNFASSITMDSAMMYASNSSNDFRKSTGAPYGGPAPAYNNSDNYNANYSSNNNNPYAPPAYGGGPTATNPYGAQPAPSFTANAYANYNNNTAAPVSSNALTTYGAPPPAAPYVDSTGRMAYNNNPYATNPLNSPSAQSTSSFQSYGSAPTFAQPPQATQQPQQYSYGAYGAPAQQQQQPPPSNAYYRNY